MHIQLAEDLGRVQEMGVVEDPAQRVSEEPDVSARGLNAGPLLLDIPGEQRYVEDEGHPVSVDQEHEREESVDGNFGDDVGVEAVAEIDGVDVVTVGQTQVSNRWTDTDWERATAPASRHRSRNPGRQRTIQDRYT